MICSKCGAENDPSAENCTKCGWGLRSRLAITDQVCANHPARFASSICHACGLEMCEACEVFINGVSYCRECAERPSEDELLRNVRIVDPEHAKSATLGERATAVAVDVAILASLFIVLWVASWLLFGDPTVPLSHDEFPWGHAIFWMIVAVGVPAYFILSISSSAQTLGMSAVDIAVVRETGEAVDNRTIVLRYIAMFPAVVSVFGILWSLWDVKGRMLHDRLTKTRVVKLG